MTVPSHSLRTACATATDGARINRDEALALFNPDRARNSAIEHIVHDAHEYGVPRAVVSRWLALLRPVVELNDAEYGIHTGLADDLADLARVAHRAERPHPMREAITVKGLAEQLRPYLQVLRRSDDRTARLHAERAVRRICEGATHAQLTGSLRHELKPGPHARLLALLGLTVGVEQGAGAATRRPTKPLPAGHRERRAA